MSIVFDSIFSLSNIDIFIIAVEASGDNLGSFLIESLIKMNPKLKIAGVGGYNMQKQGLKSIIDIRDLSVMGFKNVVLNFTKILKSYFTIRRFLKINKPKILVTIDYPDFNNRIARFAKSIGITTIHYVAPSVWAWKSNRAKKISKIYTHLLCLFDFEPQYFIKYGLKATFVGHSVVQNKLEFDNNYRKKFNIPFSKTIICLLCGSREQEIRTHLPIFLNALENNAYKNNFWLVLPVLNHLKPLVKSMINYSSMPTTIVNSTNEKWQTYMHSAVALGVSGTINVELAYTKLIQIIAYKTSKINYFIIKQFIKIKYISLVNIILNKKIVPELIQDDCNEIAINEALDDLLNNNLKQQELRDNYDSFIEKICSKDSNDNILKPSDLAAKIINQYL